MSLFANVKFNDLRWVYEGVIDDPYGEFFITENKSLQKVHNTKYYHYTS